MNNLKIYENQGFEYSPPDYVFDSLGFIGTCGSCPEQYDVIMLKDGKLYQVGYVRLRGGKLRVECPDCGGEEVHRYIFDDDEWKGCFDGEDERVAYLQGAAKAIQGWLKGEGYEY